MTVVYDSKLIFYFKKSMGMSEFYIIFISQMKLFEHKNFSNLFEYDGFPLIQETPHVVFLCLHCL